MSNFFDSDNINPAKREASEPAVSPEPQTKKRQYDKAQL